MIGMGYGSRAISLLTKYYQGELSSDVMLTDDEASEAIEKEDARMEKTKDTMDDDRTLKKETLSSLQVEKIKPRKSLPPLLLPLTERPAERLHWFGTSFGLTLPLYAFWNRAGFRSVYIRQTANPLTGEHTSIMLHALKCDDLPASPAPGWLDEFVMDARKRFLSLLAYEFRTLPTSLALSLLTDQDEPTSRKKNENADEHDNDEHNDNDRNHDESTLSETQSLLSRPRPLTRASHGLISARDLQVSLSPFDIKRLQSYAKNMVDYHMIVDLIPLVARLYFLNRLPNTTLSYLQRAILMSLGLQHQSIDALVSELNVPSNQLLALFNKSMRKFSTAFYSILEADVVETMKTDIPAPKTMEPTIVSLSDDLADAKDHVLKQMKQKELLEGLNLHKYAVKGNDADWAEALSGKGNEITSLHNGIVQVKGTKKAPKLKRCVKETTGCGSDDDNNRKSKQHKNVKSKRSKYANLK